MDSASDLADGVSELPDGVATKHGTALHGTRLARTTRCTKKMQLSAKLGYIHCDTEDVIACAAHPGVACGALGASAAVPTRACVNVIVFLNSSPQFVSDPTDSHTLEPSFVFFAVLNKRVMPRCVELPGCPSLALPSRSRSPHHHRSPRDASTRLRRTLCSIRRVVGAPGAHDDASLARRCPRRRATSAPTTTRQRCAHGMCSRRFVHERFTLRSHRRFVHERFTGSWLT
jgi:hypothetical protein